MNEAFPRDPVAMRRALHRYPELAFREYRTAVIVAGRLAELGYGLRIGPDIMRIDDPAILPSAADIARAQDEARRAGADPALIDRMPGGQTAVCGELRRGNGPVTVLRFDMDALPVTETSDRTHRPTSGGYASIRPGLMHACGHDGHVAIGLAVAEALARPDARWSGTLRLLFQPAEEGGRGALPIVASGLMDDVDVFLVAHLGCQLPSGKIALMADGFLWATKRDVTFSGRGSHAAMAPEEGRNALLAAAMATLGLHALPRDGQTMTRVNVGRLVAGTARNVIADHAEMEMELRAGTEAALARLAAASDRVLEGAALTQGCSVATRVRSESISIESDREIRERLRRAALAVGGLDIVEAAPIGGGDDATYLMRRVQEHGGRAGYCLIGADLADAHHASAFDFDEAALPVAVSVMQAFVENR
jgi:aminobenzoyl-glutamate utilization protein A